MKLSTKLPTYLILISISFAVLLPYLDSKLIYSSFVYRHGARYPLHDCYDFNQTK